MQPTVKSVTELFQQRIRFVVPLFQRTYVWNVDDQWHPLWEDIERQAQKLLAVAPGAPYPPDANHFLGAIVVQREVGTTDGSPPSASVIDGQQRLTTLQVLLAAIRDYLSGRNHTLVETLKALTSNTPPHARPTDGHKVWRWIQALSATSMSSLAIRELFFMGRARGLSDSEKRELWLRWKRGETTVEIGRALGQSTGRVWQTLRTAGGIAPAARKRREKGLRIEEREEISRGLIAGHSLRVIASSLSRAVSTVSREVARNGGRQGYRAILAEERALRRARRPKLCLLALNAPLRRAVAEKLALRWSPQQISGWLRRAYGSASAMSVSHETIYKSLFVQARGVLKRELLGVLRSRKRMRRAHGADVRGMKRSLIPDAVSIRERPASAEDRAVPGHWEGDLLMGGTGSRMATLVERRSRFLMLVKIGAKTSDDVVAALARRVRVLPDQMMASLTWDRGSELTSHAKFTLATKVAVYFCDPRSPWQRGSNENTNGLLRQYFPRGTDVSRLTQAQLDAVARELNARPRKTLGYRTPAELFAETVASTA